MNRPSKELVGAQDKLRTRESRPGLHVSEAVIPIPQSRQLFHMSYMVETPSIPPMRTPMILPYTIPYVTLSKEFRL